MIQANELRIGNLVKDVDAEIINIEEIDCKGITGCFNKIIVEIGPTPSPVLTCRKFETINGISLTSEILDRCGFQPFQKNNFFKSYITIDDLGDGNWVVAEFDQVDGGIHLFRNTIKYLHQLQNLYFALTGEELTIPIL
jgi:hypothetical protein